MEKTLDYQSLILERIRRNVSRFGDQFPHDAPGLQYSLSANTHWMTAFWTGNLWLAYAVTGDTFFRDAAAAHLSSFDRRIRNGWESHDIGFLYTLSARAHWQLTGSQQARDLALLAATKLAERFHEKGEYIQAWGPIGDPKEGGRFIIDCMMNLPLLWWAARESGNTHLADVAERHALTNRLLVRDDFSTYHTYFMDQATGQPLGPRQKQGYSETSMWTRGQAWGIFGYTVAYMWTQNAAFLEITRGLADRFLAEITPDFVSLWDLRLPVDKPQQKDTSGNVIAAGGMYRLAGLLGEDGMAYLKAAQRLIKAVETPEYIALDAAAEGWLKSSVYNMNSRPAETFMPFGDYFYLETSLLMQGRVPDFWYPAP